MCYCVIVLDVIVFVLFTSSVVVNRNLIGLIVIPLRLAKHLGVGFTHLSIYEPCILDLFGYINTETTSSFLDLFDIGKFCIRPDRQTTMKRLSGPGNKSGGFPQRHSYALRVSGNHTGRRGQQSFGHQLELYQL